MSIANIFTSAPSKSKIVIEQFVCLNNFNLFIENHKEMIAHFKDGNTKSKQSLKKWNKLRTVKT